jgi:hypothetical protein
MKHGRAPKPAAELVAYLQESVALLTDPEGPQDTDGRALLVANVLIECEGACCPLRVPAGACVVCA